MEKEESSLTDVGHGLIQINRSCSEGMVQDSSSS